MDEDRIDLSALDPSADRRHWNALVATVTANAIRVFIPFAAVFLATLATRRGDRDQSSLTSASTAPAGSLMTQK